MLLTATEAATRRCQEGFAASDGVSFTSGTMIYTAEYVPPTPIYAGGAGMINITSQGPTAPYNCLGPQCMGWRFTERRTIDGTFLGYCGKAGRID